MNLGYTLSKGETDHDAHEARQLLVDFHNWFASETEELFAKELPSSRKEHSLGHSSSGNPAISIDGHGISKNIHFISIAKTDAPVELQKYVTLVVHEGALLGGCHP